MERYYYIISNKEDKVVDVMIKQDFKSDFPFYKERINKAFSKEILPILIDVINNTEVK